MNNPPIEHLLERGSAPPQVHARPGAAIRARPLTSAAVAARFAKGARGPVAAAAFGYLAAFYGGFAAYAAGRLPAWVFAAAGLLVFIRYFDLTHEEIHTRGGGPWPWHALRYVFSVSGPLQLGYTQIARNHRLHHAHEGTAQDPDVWIMHASPAVAALRCLTQPEQAVWRYVKANGIDRRLAFDLALHLAFWLALAGACTGPQFLLYNAVVRLGNGVSWFVFTYLLHRAELYNDFAPLPLPRWLRWTWRIAIGQNNLNAITYHFLHHAYGSVPSRALPELSAALGEATAP